MVKFFFTTIFIEYTFKIMVIIQRNAQYESGKEIYLSL